MKVNILFGGKAGQGTNILSNLLGQALTKIGYYVFMSREYQSMIRGGHNFNLLTFSDSPINSNDSELDLIVALDQNTAKVHKEELKKTGEIIQKEGGENMYFAGRMFKILCIDFKILEEELKNLEKFEENIKEAKKGYAEEKKEICKVILNKEKLIFMNGNQGISEGAIKSGLDIYYAYPMTPATNVMTELSKKQIEKNILVLELENEIAIINAAIGSAMTGAKTMIGTSGGGFDLMTESFSLVGMAEIPLVIYLASRPGPSTGAATYTAQGDLEMLRFAGHGEFPRVISAPGDPKEAQELTSQAFYFSQKFGVPAIVLSDKHLAESAYTLSENPIITTSLKTTSMRRYQSHEADEFGSTSDDAELIMRNVEKRRKKEKEIEEEEKKFAEFNIYGNKNSKNIIVSWGSTKGAIVDAIKDLDVKFLQVLYLEPFAKIKKELEGKNIILIENNATGQLGKVIAEKTGIFIEEKNKILKYDGRPFFSDKLRLEIQKRISTSSVAEHQMKEEIRGRLK